MKIVIEIPKFAWIEDIKDFKSAVKEYDKGSAFDHAIREALLLGTPLPEHHGRIIDESKITSVYYHEETYKSTVRHYHTVIDGTDAPTIIEGSDSE